MLDVKEEKKYSRLRKLAMELHIPMPEVFITLEVFDKHGNLLQKHRQRSHSWTRNAYNMLFLQMTVSPATDNTFGAGLLSIKELGAVVKFHATNPVAPWESLTSNLSVPSAGGILSLAGGIDHGIIVGSGTNVESFEDYVLQTPIAEGTGGGQLNAVASELHDISYAGLTLKDELVRFFNNNSGGVVNVNEVAIAVAGKIAGGFSDWLYTRDKLGATVTVPDTGQVKVTYTIELTYPS